MPADVGLREAVEQQEGRPRAALADEVVGRSDREGGVVEVREGQRASLITSRVTSAGMRSVAHVEDAVLVRLGRRERELAWLRAVLEEPRTRAASQRVDEEVQAVDQAVGQHRSDQRAAAADVDVAV